MLSDRHPVIHIQVRAGDIQNYQGRRLIPNDRCHPDTILSVPVQYTEDTETLFNSVCTHKEVKKTVYSYVEKGYTKQISTTISTHKQELRDRGKLPNTGGNCRVVLILVTVKRLSKPIRPVDAGYLWEQLDSIQKRDVLAEPYKKAPADTPTEGPLRTEGEVDVTDSKYEACAKQVTYPKADQDTELAIQEIVNVFGIEQLHPWQHDLLKKFVTSMNRYEALNFGANEGKLMGNINREAVKDIGGNNNNGMKATYQIHDHLPASAQGAGAIDHMIEIDLSTVEEQYAATLDINLNGEPMKNFENRVFIQGRDAATMSEDAILDTINHLEDQIKRYEEMPTKTKVVAKRVKGLKADLKELVAYIDRNETDDDAADSAE